MTTEATLLGWQAWATLGVIIIMIVALAREIARPDLILIGSLALLLISGILEPAEALSGFSNQAVFTVGALFVVAAGVQRTQAINFTDTFFASDKKSITGTLFRLMGMTSVSSAFLNNTPIVAMMIPRVQSIASKLGISPSKLLIPLSYAAIVGGIITLIGTSTNIIVSGMLAERGYAEFSFFEITWIGLPAAIIVILYFATIGHRLLPEGKIQNETDNEGSGVHSFQFELKVPEHSKLVNKTVKDAGLRALKQAFLTHIRRGKHIIGPIGPDDLIQKNDILTFYGDPSVIDQFLADSSLTRVIEMSAEAKMMPLYEAVLAPTSPLIGKTLKESGFREKYQGVVLAIHRQDEEMKGALGSIPLKPGDLLLIEAKKGFDALWNSEKNQFYLVAPRERESLPVSEKSGIAIGILLLLILTMVSGLIPIVTAAIAGAIAMLVTGCVKRSEAGQAVNMPVLIVIGCAIGIGLAVEKTGLAEVAAMHMLSASSGFGPIAALAAIYIITNVLTEIITNNAAAVLMVPIAIAASVSMGIDPHAAAITVAVAASASFLTPIGYQTNLMVMGAGGYKYTDYFKAGLPVTLIMMTVTVYISWLFWG